MLLEVVIAHCNQWCDVNVMQQLWTCLKLGRHLMHESWQIVYGMYKIMRLPRPCVSIFGGGRLSQDSVYAKQAHALAHALVEADIAVLTGGGPGIMEAANCGAASAEKPNVPMTMGIGITDMRNEEGLNACVAGRYILLDYFFARKWLLINYSVGFVIFPGGLGTMDELSDLLNMMHTGKLPLAPVILMDSDFWKPYQAWLARSQQEGLIAPLKTPLVSVTDHVDEVIALLKAHCAQC